MKAVVYTTYGGPDVLKLKEIQKPVPEKDEVLIKIHASTATAAEGMMRRGDTIMSRVVLGFTKPARKYQILGLELAGTIEALGKNVSRFEVGKKVYGFTGFKPGAYAEYICMNEKASLVRMPDNLDFNEAASVVDGSTTAYFFLIKKAKIRAGQRVLIIGASGSIGSYAVQLSNYLSANVTGVCSTKNIAMVQNLGAKRVIDYTNEDFTQEGITYDVIFDTVGKSSYSECKPVLSKRGIYLATNGRLLANLYLNVLTSLRKGKKFIYAMSVDKREALNYITPLLEEKKMRPVIDKVYHLENIVEAHQYVESGHKRGNVVIQIIN
jgi:NADPH2:quinone reductase